MNEQTPINPVEPITRLEALRQRRGARPWVAGLILVILGMIFLLQNFGVSFFPLKNWWALFILMPAVGTLSASYQIYRDAGNRLTAPAGVTLMLGGMLTLFTIAFLFDIDWSYFGPAMLILAGAGLLINSMFFKR